ncbi:MAG: extracellular solute-binding protein [Rariglobus sp.]
MMRLASPRLFNYALSLGVALSSFCGARLVAAPSVEEQIKVSVVSRFYDPNQPEASPNLVDLMKRDRDLTIEMWSGLALPGGGGRSAIIMSIAGQTSPDIMESWFHVIRNDIDQGFLYPLNEWIGDDLNGNGEIDLDEAKWDGWKDVPPLWRKVATVDGKVYGLPQASVSTMGVLFRTDLARNAGLDPSNPPTTWDEYYEWALRLTDPGVPVPGRIYNEGQKAMAMVPYGFTWLPWVQSAGGEPIVQVRTDPKTGREHVFSLEEKSFVLPDGIDLTSVKPEFRANFDSPEAIKAAGFYHRLRWGRWMVDPETGNPVVLDDAAVAAGEVMVGDRVVRFTPAQVRQGVGRAHLGSRDTDPLQLLGRGEVAMTTWFVTDLLSTGNTSGLNPDLLSWFPIPSGSPGAAPVVQLQRHYASMATNVSLRPKAERDKVWEVMQGVTDHNASDATAARMVAFGLARFVDPRTLTRLGYDDYVRTIPTALRDVYGRMDTGEIKSFTEPYQGFWTTMDGSLNREVLGILISQSGEKFDYVAALKAVNIKANSGVMFARPKAELDEHRPLARVIFAVIAAGFVALAVMIVRSMFKKKSAGAAGMVNNRFLPWLILLPALVLIGTWGYYPLIRGMVMAFQNFRVAGESPFVGLDNFITLALDRSFWASMGTTVYYVTLTMMISFTAPIALAIMLSEVPRGKMLYRTLFFLPQVTSGLVIALLWKLMFDPRPNGIFNQVVAIFNYIPGVEIGAQSWLEDPSIAMICVVLPGAWASAGMASLIYLAALKSVPEDTYEACEIDGGGILVKLRHITLPVLMPLIIINFLGAFIATFQNMGNIFLLTFGGPGETTMVVSMKIWIEAYNNLRFSIATSMAWIVGACLISFTFLQMQVLKRVEFRRSKD